MFDKGKRARRQNEDDKVFTVVSGGTHGSRQGDLISRGASRLDAFSAYPCRAWPPCHGADPQQVHQRPVRPGP